MKDNDNLSDIFCLMTEIRKQKVLPRRSLVLAEGEYGILHLLYDNDKGMKPGEFSQILGVGTGRIGNALKNMESKGIIIREDDPDDKRKTIVTLTKKGKSLAKSLDDDFNAGIGYAISKMGKDRYDEYLSLMKDFYTYLIEYKTKEVKKNA